MAKTIRFFAFMACWFVVFAIGLLVQASSQPATLYGFVIFLLSSTTTNVGILAVLSSLLKTSERPWIVSAKRGFTIYLMVISGVVVVFTESLTAPTPQQYSKIAGMVSLLCVVCSYRPQLFNSFMDRVALAFSSPEEPAD